ncbi:hypothetical protein IFM89_010134 [Coptis chinensis]|uniref:RNase H type-1 domain-containing protein n=1 Tax=Coptis chinensis TaxID=261450 RepID=A0A835IC76_9MAGN|nr:hypothetical protein IFM89_010134 [Coptis chinensis]
MSEGRRLAAERGIRKLLGRSDFLRAVNIIKSTEQPPGYCLSLVAAITRTCSSFEMFRVEHAYLECNQVADYLARLHVDNFVGVCLSGETDEKVRAMQTDYEEDGKPFVVFSLLDGEESFAIRKCQSFVKGMKPTKVLLQAGREGKLIGLHDPDPLSHDPDPLSIRMPETGRA